MEKLRQCRNNYRKGGCFDGKKHSEKEKTSLDSPSPKLNKSMIAYHETGDLLRMRLSIQFWFKGTGCWENELL